MIRSWALIINQINKSPPAHHHAHPPHHAHSHPLPPPPPAQPPNQFIPRTNDLNPVADPGFSRGGGVNPPGGREHAKFSRKLHEIERIWTPRGGRASLTPPLDPPMKSNVNMIRCFDKTCL